MEQTKQRNWKATSRHAPITNPPRHKTCSHITFVKYQNHLMQHCVLVLIHIQTCNGGTSATRKGMVSNRLATQHAKPLTQHWSHTPEYNESDSHSSCSRADFLLLERVLRDLMSSPPLANRKRSFSPKRLILNSAFPMPMPSKV
jgi:hypothetical protein